MNTHFKLIILVGTFLAGTSAAIVLVDSFARAESSFLSNTAITVNTLGDELNSDGDCSLREAIAAANTNVATDACPAGDAVITDTINFVVSSMIQISTTLEVTAGGPLVIDGAGAITIDGGDSPNLRLFYVNKGADLDLEGLRITSGSADNGSGIYNSGNLVLTNSTLSDNVARGSNAGGGAIYNNGLLSIISSTLSGNTAFNRLGGGIYNVGLLTLSYSVLSGNSANRDGGGIYNNGEMTITKSTLSGNEANSNGGGIYNLGTISLVNSTLASNSALSGGGVYNHLDGELYISNSTLSGNNVTSDGGGIYSQGTLTIASSTLSSNSAGEFGGGIRGTGQQLTLRNTILADNSSTKGGPDCYVMTAATEGYNLVGIKEGCDFIPTTGDLTNIDAKLGSLGDNGGPTLTHALLPGSPAIDAGNPAGCADHLGNPLTSDQRGFPRSGRCDIGAYESQAVASRPNLFYLPNLLRSCPTRLFFDDFSNPSSGWAIYDNEDARFEYVNDEYRILVKNPQLLVGTSSGFKASDYVAAVDVRNYTGVDGTYGIAFGISDDWTTFYTFEVNSDGGYAIWRIEPSNWILLAEGHSDRIHPGTVTNQLKVKRNGAQIWAYANGELLNIVNQGDFMGMRNVGLIVSSFDQSNVDARFDNFTIYPITCGSSGVLLSEESEMYDVEGIDFDRVKNWESYKILKMLRK